MQAQSHPKKRGSVAVGGVAIFPRAKKARSISSMVVSKTRPTIRRPNNFEGIRGGVVLSGSPNPEKKNNNVSVAATAVDTGTPYVASLLSALAEGTTLTTRVGGKIQVKSIDIEGNYIGVLASNVAINTTPAYCDVFLVWDKQPDGAVPAASTIFTTTTTNLTFGNIAQTERFVVLRRESFVSSFNGDNAATWKWHVPLDCATKFPDATGSPNTNDFYVCALSTNAAAATAVIANSIAYTSRVKFTDA